MCVCVFELYAVDFRDQKVLDPLELVVDCSVCVLGSAFMFFARAESGVFIWIHLFNPFSLF